MSLSTETATRALTLDDCRQGFDSASQGVSELLPILLAEQAQLTAVEQFSRDHEDDDLPRHGSRYSRLLPAAPPGPGQQYAFDVDLDRCSGCKACVTACHSLNGLDEEETWRDVGLLVGGNDAAPVMQHVTAACHHCLEPACMIACPVDAYEKDPETGIVRHLDDQCFGCQYCTLACPYNVPKYHHQKGIVRKCDMCSHRLSAGEAPACVQSCPHEAIAIRIVDVRQVIDDSETTNFLPAAPEPFLTLPTTTYRTERVFPRNMLPADYHSVSPQHPHWPLIVMLVLTQLSVGALTAGCILEASLPRPLADAFRPFHATSAVCLGLLALLASVCHLGRPLYAFRGILGLRHSWLSREILAFGLFAGMAVPYALACWGHARWEPLSTMLPYLGGLVAAVGAAGVFCSAMIYVFTRRDFWSFERTFSKFVLTAAVLGLSTTWLSLLVMCLLHDETAATTIATQIARPLTFALCGAALIKLLADASVLRHLADFRNTPLKRTALLLTGPLSNAALARFAIGIVSGMALPLLLLSQLAHAENQLTDSVTLMMVVMMWLGTLAGETLERYLFFAAVAAPRMPGGLRT